MGGVWNGRTRSPSVEKGLLPIDELALSLSRCMACLLRPSRYTGALSHDSSTRCPDSLRADPQGSQLPARPARSHKTPACVFSTAAVTETAYHPHEARRELAVGGRSLGARSSQPDPSHMQSACNPLRDGGWKPGPVLPNWTMDSAAETHGNSAKAGADVERGAVGVLVGRQEQAVVHPCRPSASRATNDRRFVDRGRAPLENSCPIRPLITVMGAAARAGGR